MNYLQECKYCKYLCPIGECQGKKVTVKVHTLDTAPLRDTSPRKHSGTARDLKRSQFFYLYTHTFIRNRNEPYLPLPGLESTGCTIFLLRMGYYTIIVSPTTAYLLRLPFVNRAPGLYFVFRLDALALSVIATATWLAGWLGGCLSQPVLYQNY